MTGTGTEEKPCRPGGLQFFTLTGGGPAGPGGGKERETAGGGGGRRYRRRTGADSRWRGCERRGQVWFDGLDGGIQDLGFTIFRG